MDNSIDNIKKQPIKEFLSNQGIYPNKDYGTYGMYRSPLREDPTPSFKVDFRKNLWYDFGQGRGGDIIELVQVIDNCNFISAVNKLKDRNCNLSMNHNDTPSIAYNQSKLEVLKVEYLHYYPLVSYVESRGIPASLAQKELKQVTYKSKDREFIALGFQNDKGGWELRNKHIKGATSKAPTIIKQKDCKNTVLFEGFFNYLSFKAMYPKASNNYNYVVLNSITMIDKAMPFLRSQKNVYSFLDLDKPGVKLYNQLQKDLNKTDTCLHNCAEKIHIGFTDLNDYLKQRVETDKKKGIKIK